MLFLIYAFFSININALIYLFILISLELNNFGRQAYGYYLNSSHQHHSTRTISSSSNIKSIFSALASTSINKYESTTAKTTKEIDENLSSYSRAYALNADKLELEKNYRSNTSCLLKTRILPRAIVIGVKKSGTYALLRYLGLNPNIKVALKINNCNLNELHYFDHEENYNRGLSWYKKQMPEECLLNRSNGYRTDLSKLIAIEKTPGYFRNEKAPQRIYEYNKNIKLLLIVRDPVKRLQSELTHCDARQKKLGIQRKCANLSNWFEETLKSNNLTQLEENKFIRNSIYYLDMKRWLLYFSLEQFYILNGENFIKQPWVELNKLEKFLNVDEYINKQHFQFDSNKNFYCLRNSNRRRRNEKGGESSETSDTDCLGKNKGRKSHVYLSDYVKNGLRNYFERWNLKFYELIGQNFNW
jgi:hypothetical protein